MRVTVNGVRREAAEGATLADIARDAGVTAGEAGVAAAVDGTVVPRRAWADTVLRDGTTVEVVRAAAGG